MSDTFDRLVNVVKRLRAPDGCPWDRKQTLYSLKQNVIEEVFELIDALDRKDIENIKEELGDMLLHVVFHSIVAQEEGLFTLDDVIKTITEKLIRRHPHVFGNTRVNSVEEVLQNWEAIKAKEHKENNKKHYLDDVPAALPPIERALKLQKKAQKVGFDWEDPHDCLNKVEEELSELKDAIASKDKEALRHELGDLMFAVINLARMLQINPSESLRLANIRFKKRFDCMEDALKREGKALKEADLNQMEEKWQECKKQDL